MLVHGMGETRAAWDAALAALAPGHRVVAVDRRGYGATPAPEGYEGTTVSEHGEDLVRLVEELGLAPALLAGRDFGALVCLDVLVRRSTLARGAVLVAPPLYSLVPEATDALTAERIALGERVHDSGPRAAMEAWLGRPADVDPRAFFADWAGLASLPVTRRELRAVDVPVRVLVPPRTEPHARRAAAALAKALPAGELTEGDDVVAALAALSAL